MKKILGIICSVVYLFTALSVTHAFSMGILDMHGNTPNQHCHNDPETINCCELVFSNQYSENKPKTENKVSIISFIFTNKFDYKNINKNINGLLYQRIYSSPGWNPDIKFQKFSDLSGIVVKTT